MHAVGAVDQVQLIHEAGDQRGERLVVLRLLRARRIVQAGQVELRSEEALALAVEVLLVPLRDACSLGRRTSDAARDQSSPATSARSSPSSM